jgi:hypothetical protein
VIVRTSWAERRGARVKLKGKPVAKVQPILTVSKQEAAQILYEIAEADKGDDWAAHPSWK